MTARRELEHLPGRVPVMQHQVVAIRIGEERHGADAGVHYLAGEHDPFALQLAACRRDVVDVQGGMPMKSRP